MIDLPQLQQKIVEIAPQYAIEAAFLYGSQAREETHPKSDVDIALMTTRPLTFEENYAISEGIRQIVRKDVQVVTFRDASPVLLRQIADEGITLFGKDTIAADNARLYALKRYHEAKGLMKLRFADMRLFLGLPVPQ